MNIKHLFRLSLSAACVLLAAACSQEEYPAGTEADGLVPVTLSATIDHGVQTRAVTSDTDDEATRYLLQIIESDGTTTTKREVQAMDLGTDGYTATAMLNPNNTYTFLFWADDGSYTAIDLEAVTIADEASEVGIAWYGSASWNISEITEIKATLTHAVTKVTLQSTTAVSELMTATIKGVKEYSTFNVADGTVSNEASFTHSGYGSGQEGDVFSFYALVDGNTQNLTLNTGAAEVKIPSVPLAANKHVILSGDVAAAGLKEFTFTATIDDSWGSTVTEDLVDFTQDASGNYTVYTAKGLQAWASHVNQGNWDTDCTLAADITLTGENNWTPVGSNIYAYSGTFDGAGHTISGMNISGGTHTQGFIGHLSGTVKNLTITGASVNGSSTVGGIVGYAEAESSITGCTFSGTVSANQHQAGGIVGYAEECHITGCSASGTVSGTSSVGGIVGNSYDSQITACWSTAGVTASTNGGCIVGNSSGTSYTACYWGNTTTTTGNGSGSGDDIIHVEGNVTWSTAMEVMNNALANSDYQWEFNTGSDTEKVPLVLVRQ